LLDRFISALDNPTYLFHTSGSLNTLFSANNLAIRCSILMPAALFKKIVSDIVRNFLQSFPGFEALVCMSRCTLKVSANEYHLLEDTVRYAYKQKLSCCNPNCNVAEIVPQLRKFTPDMLAITDSLRTSCSESKAARSRIKARLRAEGLTSEYLSPVPNPSYQVLDCLNADVLKIKYNKVWQYSATVLILDKGPLVLLPEQLTDEEILALPPRRDLIFTPPLAPSEAYSTFRIVFGRPQTVVVCSSRRSFLQSFSFPTLEITPKQLLSALNNSHFIASTPALPVTVQTALYSPPLAEAFLVKAPATSLPLTFAPIPFRFNPDFERPPSFDALHRMLQDVPLNSLDKEFIPDPSFVDLTSLQTEIKFPSSDYLFHMGANKAELQQAVMNRAKHYSALAGNTRAPFLHENLDVILEPQASSFLHKATELSRSLVMDDQRPVASERSRR